MPRLRLRRRAALMGAVALVVLGSLAAPVAAAPPDIRIDGSVALVDRFDFGAPCTFVHGVWDGTFQPARGRPWALHVDECTDAVGSILVLTGTFTLVAPGGSLEGTISGSQPLGPVASYDVTIEDGTRRFRGASGSLELSGTWDTSVFGAFVFSGSLGGTLTR